MDKMRAFKPKKWEEKLDDRVLKMAKKYYPKDTEDWTARHRALAFCAESFSIVANLIKQERREEREKILYRHIKKVESILNKHSLPISEGGLDYVKAFEEMENYEHELHTKYFKVREKLK